MTLNANGSFTYQPKPNFRGNDSFTYQTVDGSLYSSVSTVTLSPAAPYYTTNTTLSASATSVAYGQPVTLSAVVNDVAGDGVGPSGTVTFEGASNGQVIGTGQLALVNGQEVASYTTSSLAAGGHSVIAIYAGDSVNVGSTSTALSVTIGTPPVSAVASASPSPAVVGQNVSLTAVVSTSNTNGVAPTGTVTFVGAGNHQIIGTATLAIVSGQDVAVYTTNTLAVGGHSILAVYSGDANYPSTTTAAFSLTINPDATITTLSTATNPAVVGQPVKLTAVVTPAIPGGGVPTGPVTFMDGSTVLGTGGLYVSNGQDIAVLTTQLATAGSQSLTAVYGTTINYSTSTSAAVAESIGPASTKISGSAGGSSAVVGQSVTLSAVVSAASPGSGTPTGSVTFVGAGNHQTIGTGTLSVVGGQDVATVITSSLAEGAHSILAIYAGDGNYLTSTTTAFSITINPDATNTTLTTSVNPAVVGQQVTLTAVVAADGPGGGVPTGPVTFMDGSTVLGTGGLYVANGQDIAVLVTTFATSGIHSLTAIYGTTTSYTTSTSSAVSETVNVSAQNAAVVSGRQLTPAVVDASSESDKAVDAAFAVDPDDWVG